MQIGPICNFPLLKCEGMMREAFKKYRRFKFSSAALWTAESCHCGTRMNDKVISYRILYQVTV